MKVNNLVDKSTIIKQVRSTIGCTERQKAVIKGLGLRGVGSITELKVDKSIMGMINKVTHLVEVNIKN